MTIWRPDACGGKPASIEYLVLALSGLNRGEADTKGALWRLAPPGKSPPVGIARLADIQAIRTS